MPTTSKEATRGWLKSLFSPTILITTTILLMIGIVTFAIYFTHLTRIIERRFSGQLWAIPSKVYSDSFPLYVGMNALDMGVLHKIRRLDYIATNDQIKHAGEYRTLRDQEGGTAAIEIYLNPFSYPQNEFQGLPLEIKFNKSSIASMRNMRTNEDLSFVELEPELITEFFQGTREVRSEVKLKDVPPNLLNAIMAIEDQRFLEHEGVDIRGIFRAFFANIMAGGKVVQGGSTLTQQLVKNFFLTPERSLKRKMNEALMALIIEMKYPKDKILELYVNEIYLGQKGSAEIHGVGEATQYYFSKPLKELTLSEAALLSGVIRWPNYYNPFQYYERTLERRDHVLDEMINANLIVREEYDDAKRDRPKLRQTFIISNSAPYFVDYVRHQLLELYDESVLGTEGLRIFTTLNTLMQEAADKAVAEGVVDLEKTYPHVRTPPKGGFPHWRGRIPPHWISETNVLQAALVSIEPQTGHIKAMTGGKGYQFTQLNRIFQSKRQTGSTFKPFTYVAALRDPEHRWSLDSPIADAPFTWVFAGGLQSWSPSNYDNRYRGTITLHYALRHSLNVPTARLGSMVGLENVIKAAKDMGIETEFKKNPSVVLGATDLSPLELAAAYSTLANNCVYVKPVSINMIVDKNRRILEQRASRVRRGIEARVAYLITYVLQDVILRGTGVRVRGMGFTRPAAGKTGTTNEFIDAWFAGFTPELCTVVWVGFDHDRVLDLPGSQGAIPIWTNYMKVALKGYPETPFPTPTDTQFETVEGERGETILREVMEGETRPSGPRKNIFDVFKNIF